MFLEAFRLLDPNDYGWVESEVQASSYASDNPEAAHRLAEAVGKKADDLARLIASRFDDVSDMMEKNTEAAERRHSETITAMQEMQVWKSVLSSLSIQ